MRYVRIFSLHLQDVFQNRGRSLVYFLMGLVNPLLQLVFWSGAIAENGGNRGLWSFGEMASYYLLITVAMSLLVVHIEEDVAFLDIKEGVLAKYLLRPFSYFISKFMEELPWRFIQGFFAIIVFIAFVGVVGISFPLVGGPMRVSMVFVIAMLALIISYTLKMLLGLLALWTTDFWGIMSVEEVVFLLLGGIVMPLAYYPSSLASIAYVLPFSHIIYFPVIAVQGKLTETAMVSVIGSQLVWILVLYILYRIIWKKGIKKFTAVGQ